MAHDVAFREGGEADPRDAAQDRLRPLKAVSPSRGQVDLRHVPGWTCLASRSRSCAASPGIRFTTFTERDVVRHPLVQEIISAYDKAER